MRIATLALSSVLLLASCTQDEATKFVAEPDSVLLKARALQALVCVQLERVPSSWKSDFRLNGPCSNENWQTLSDQPLVPHGYKVSSVYRQATRQLCLVVEGGSPEAMAVYGPLSNAPECLHAPATAASAA